MNDFDEKEIRIPDGTAMLMIGTALLYDALQALFVLIPFLGWFLSFMLMLWSFLTFNVVWFHIRGIKFFESLIGKGGRALVRWLLCSFLEVVSVGAIPGITVWIILTILQTRLDDNLVAHKIVTREELELIDQSVKKLYKQHGAESPEFRQALAHALGEQIEHRLNKTIDNKRARLISEHRIARVLDNAVRNSDYG